MCSGDVIRTKRVTLRSASMRLTITTSSRVFFDSDSGRMRSAGTPASTSACRSAADSGAAAGSRSVIPPDAITSTGSFSKSNTRAASSTRSPASIVTVDS